MMRSKILSTLSPLFLFHFSIRKPAFLQAVHYVLNLKWLLVNADQIFGLLHLLLWNSDVENTIAELSLDH